MTHCDEVGTGSGKRPSLNILLGPRSPGRDPVATAHGTDLVTGTVLRFKQIWKSYLLTNSDSVLASSAP